MLRADLLALGDVGVVEAGAVLQRDDQERAERRRAGQAEQFGQKLCGFPLVAGRDDGVVEADTSLFSPSSLV